MRLIRVESQPIHGHVAGNGLVLDVDLVLQVGRVLVADAEGGVICKAAYPSTCFARVVKG